MTMVRLSSSSAPFDVPDVRRAATRLVLMAEGLGLLPSDATVERLDADLIRDIARRSLTEGVGQASALAILEDTASTTSGARWIDLIERLEGALEGSPMPGRELVGLSRTYGHELLSTLLGISPASLRRYLAGTRSVPDVVAARAHFLALLTADLAGSYNDIGLRRWWERPRSRLEGRSPRAALGEVWDPEETDARAVAGLARELAGSGAAV